MQNSTSAPHLAWDPDTTAVAGAETADDGAGGGGDISAAGSYYSTTTELRSFGIPSDVIVVSGTLQGTLKAEVSNASDDEIVEGTDEWTDVTNPSVPAIDVGGANRVVDTDDLVFTGVGSGDDLTARLATTAALPSVVAAGSGVGKTLTASANGALTVDGVAVALNDLVLVKDQVNQVNNGLYKQTTLGDGSTKFVLTRSTSLDQDAEATPGKIIKVTAGTVNADTHWVLEGDGVTQVLGYQQDPPPAYRFYRLRLVVTSGAGSVKSRRVLRAVQ